VKLLMRDAIKIDHYWSFVGTNHTPIVERQNRMEYLEKSWSFTRT
jgi:hypothetical protein